MATEWAQTAGGLGDRHDPQCFLLDLVISLIWDMGTHRRAEQVGSVTLDPHQSLRPWSRPQSQPQAAWWGAPAQLPALCPRPTDQTKQVPPLLEGSAAAQDTRYHDNNASHHQDVGGGQVDARGQQADVVALQGQSPDAHCHDSQTSQLWAVHRDQSPHPSPQARPPFEDQGREIGGDGWRDGSGEAGAHSSPRSSS